jgi:hypothetical protein
MTSPADTAALIERLNEAFNEPNGLLQIEKLANWARSHGREAATALADAEAQVAALKAARDELLDKLDDRIRMKPSPFDVPRGEGLFMGDDDDQ